jgi:hypothetical protein
VLPWFDHSSNVSGDDLAPEERLSTTLIDFAYRHLRNNITRLAILAGLFCGHSAYAACSGTATSATCNASGATSITSVAGARGSSPQLATP